MKNGHSTFSALEYAKELRAVGVPQEQAELQARQFELMRHEIESDLATKRDIEMAEKNFEKNIRMAEKNLEKNMETEMAKLGNTLTLRVLMIVGLFATILGLLIKIPQT